MVILNMCFILWGCGNKVSIHEIKNGNDEVILKIRNTPAYNDFYS